MDYSFDTWQKALSDFKDSVTKELEEIRLHKAEVQQMKEEIYSTLNSGYYLRDDQRIVISAPEVIIGNVDRDGTLKPDAGSVVVLRGNAVKLDGVGIGGSVHTRASSIRQTAIDPGLDGMEAVVQPLSEIVSQARQVVLEANQSQGSFSQTPFPSGDGGVRIHADGSLVVEASQSTTFRKKQLEDSIKALENEIKAADKEVSDGIKAFGDLAKGIKDIRDGQEDRLSDIANVRTNMSSLLDFESQMQSLAPALYNSFAHCAVALGRLAEANRRLNCLKAEKDALPSEGDFKKKPNGATVSVVGERIDLVSRDGDGNLRDNPEAGVGVLANSISFQAVDAQGALQKEGKLAVNAKTVEFSTQNASEIQFEKDGQQKSGKYEAQGDFVVKSKNVCFEALDQEFKDQKLEETALTKESSFTVRTEKVDFSVTDTEGKATGSIGLNAKEVAVRSMNVDKEKRTDDKLSEGSAMLLLSEKMFVGAKKKDIKSKKVQLVSEEAGLFADKTLEVQQGEAKAVLQLADGKAALSGSETQVFGKTTLNAQTEVKDELKAPKATIEHVEAKSSFKSSNISDGIPVPPPPSTASLSAKLKAEDAPEKQ